MNVSFTEMLGMKLAGPFGIYLAIVLAGVIWTWSKIRSLSSAGKAIGYIVTAVFLAESIGLVLIHAIGTNYPAYNVLHVFQFMLYGLTYARFSAHRGFKRAYFLSGMVLAILTVVDMLFFSGIANYSAIAGSVMHLYIVVAALTSFFLMLRHPERRPLQQQPLFWFNLANLFFYASTFFFYGLYDFFLAENIQKPMWVREVQKGMNYFLYSCYLVALVIDSKRHAG